MSLESRGNMYPPGKAPTSSFTRLLPYFQAMAVNTSKSNCAGFVIEALYQLNGQSLTLFRDPTLLHRHAHSLKEMIRPTGHILHMGSNSGFRDFDAFCPALLV
jgi:hypothetical protein